MPGLWVLEALSRGGVDVPAVHREVPEAVEEVLRNQEEVHPDLVNRLLDACARNAGDPDFGLRMVRLITPDMLGPFGYVLQNARDVAHLMELTHRYYAVLYRGCEVDVSKGRGRVRFNFGSPHERHFSTRHLDDWTLGFFVERIRMAVGPEWHPDRVSMQYPRPDRTEDLLAWFGPGLRFGRGRTSWFEFSDDVLGHAYDKADDGVLELVVEVAESRLEAAVRSSSFASKARLHMVDLLRSGGASQPRLAAQMAVSVSTLKRRLAEEGVTYRGLHGQAVGELAGRLLTDTELQVGTIARRLGYTDTASFTRAFRRITGLTPTEFRERE